MSDVTVSGEAYGFEMKTVGTAVVTFTSGSINPTGLRGEGAVVTCETAPIRWRCDGGSPGTAAAGTGHFLGTTDALILTGYNNLANFKAVGDNGGTTAVMKVTYYR